MIKEYFKKQIEKYGDSITNSSQLLFLIDWNDRTKGIEMKPVHYENLNEEYFEGIEFSEYTDENEFVPVFKVTELV